jgi:hypothetical protein
MTHVFILLSFVQGRMPHRFKALSSLYLELSSLSLEPCCCLNKVCPMRASWLKLGCAFACEPTPRNIARWVKGCAW